MSQGIPFGHPRSTPPPPRIAQLLVETHDMNGTMVLVGCVLAAGAVAYLGMGKGSAASNHDVSGVAGLSTSPTLAATHASTPEETTTPTPTLTPSPVPSPTTVVISLDQFRNAIGSGAPPIPRLVSNWAPPTPTAQVTPPPPVPHAPTAAPTELPTPTAPPAGAIPTATPPIEGGWTYPPTPPLPPPPYYPPLEPNGPSRTPTAEGPTPSTE